MLLKQDVWPGYYTCPMNMVTTAGSFNVSVLFCVRNISFLFPLQESECLPISLVSCWHVSHCPLGEGELVGCENASVVCAEV